MWLGLDGIDKHVAAEHLDAFFVVQEWGFPLMRDTQNASFVTENPIEMGDLERSIFQ